MANYPYPFNENVNNKYLCSDGAWKVIEDPEFLTEITYSELKQLRDNSLLVPGMKYRITDYVTTTMQADTQSAGHAFDIIVLATENNVLNENAWAAPHSGDTYFASCNLDAWEIKYTLDNIRWSQHAGTTITNSYEYSFEKTGTVVINDTTYVLWYNNSISMYFVSESEEIGANLYLYDAETGEIGFNFGTIQTVNTITENGKGTIYYMKDEFNNECPYDFKNIQFKRWKVSDSKSRSDIHNKYMGVSGNLSVYLSIPDNTDFIWCYTFSSDSSGGTQTDYSLGDNNIHDNIIKNTSNVILPNNVFFGNNCYCNTFGNNCFFNSFGNGCYFNTFGNGSYSNSFGNGCYSNSFGNGCYFNTFGNGCYSNSFGNGCNNNSFGNGCYSNSFGNYCYSHTIGNYCHENIFGNRCSSNSFGNNCNFNAFGNNCSSNSFGNSCNNNSFGNQCNSNTFGDNCSSNSFGNSCYVNSFGNYCEHNSFGNENYSNSFENNCSFNAFGNYSYFNTFGNYCENNSFGEGCKYITFGKDYTYYVIVENSNQYITVTSTQTTSASNVLRNFTISQGYNNTTTTKTISHNTVNDTFQTLYPGLVQEITYSSLVSLIAANGLTPGKKYRITDYATTTVQTGTQSAGHGFDVVVTALSRNELDENARAMKRSGDTYFANCNLDAWELKYRLENDTSNFAWADSTNGKGVIYYMKDEWDNEAPYDFKNIQFARYWITADSSVAGSSMVDTWFGCYRLDGTTKVPSTSTFDTTPKYMYTFTKLDDMISTATVSDYSVVLGSNSKSYCYGNKMELCSYGSNANKKFYLNNIVFFSTSNTSNMYGNTFGNECHSNSFGDNCYSNSFGNGCYGNSFGSECYYNFLGNNCLNNSFGNYCQSNTFGNNCQYNTFGSYYSYSIFGNNCNSNTFGYSCYNNTFGNNCYSNTFGNACSSNTLGNDCIYNIFGKDFTYYIIFENGNKYITVTSTQTTSYSNLLRNFTIAQGVNNTTTRKTISHNTVNDTFKTTYQSSNSEVVNV